MIELVSLHKHWLIADSIKQFILDSVPVDTLTEYPKEFYEEAQMYSRFMRLSVWYSLMYVVVEGYQELKLQDAEINRLLQNGEYVEALRYFRNSNFHFQKNPFSSKFTKFIELDNATEWARSLNRAFKNFFEENLPIEKTLSDLKSQ